MLTSNMNDVRQKLQDALSRNRPVFVAAPLIRWHAELFQRPQHIARALADLGALVLFFEPPARHLPQRVSRITDSLYVLPEVAFRSIIEEYPGLWVDIYSTSAMPAEAVEWLRGHGQRLIYEYVDEIDPAISAQAEKCMDLFRLFAATPPDMTIVTAAKLRQYINAEWADDRSVILSPNAADPSHFENAWRFPQETPLTKSLRERAKGRPIIGYYGALADWIDYDVIRDLAHISPDLFFCYIGPKYRPSIRLPTAANIAWPGPVDYSVLPAAASAFDLAIIPFRSGEVAKATSPLKLYEYFALRLPVVVNKDMAECLQFEYVAGAETADEWRERIRRALRLRGSESYEFFCKATVAQNTWTLRAAQMYQVIARDPVIAPVAPTDAMADLRNLLTLPVTGGKGPRALALPGDLLETAEMAVAEGLTQNLAALSLAQQAAGGRQAEQASQICLKGLWHQHREGLRAERMTHSWKTRRAVYWPKVRPVMPAFVGTPRRLALIADEFTSALLGYDSEVANLTPSNCLHRLATEDFDLFMVESVWFGHEKSWDTLWKDAKAGKGLFLRLAEAIACCRRRGVPTVFWNKEDPEHYDLFLPIARLFDQVYTTEAACLDDYRADLGHDRVGTIGFAAQSLLQTPFLQTGQQRAGLAFAGSWYRGKHDYRARQQTDLLTAGLDFGVDIYDRALRDRTGQFTYPPQFRGNIVGTLDFHRVCTAYRQYDVFLNVNTVSDSETMCARRVFEIAASRTAIVTTPSRAVARIFGDAIPNGEGVDFFREAIGTYMRAPTRRIRDAHLIYRETHRHHTYRHRLNQIFADLGSTGTEDITGEVVALVDLAGSRDGAAFLRQNLLRQSHRPRLVVLVGKPDAETRAVLQDAGVDWRASDDLPAAIAEIDKAIAELNLRAGVDRVALLHGASSYGPEYLADQMLAARLGAARMIAKDRSGQRREFQTAGIDDIDPRTLLIEVGFFQEIFGTRLSATSIDGIAFDIAARSASDELLLSDMFNYGRGGLSEQETV